MQIFVAFSEELNFIEFEEFTKKQIKLECVKGITANKIAKVGQLMEPVEFGR